MYWFYIFSHVDSVFGRREYPRAFVDIMFDNIVV